MSLATLRSDAVHAAQDHLRDARRNQRARARTLRAVTRLVTKNAGLNHFIKSHSDIENSPPPDSDEAAWLESIDLDGGHTFDEAAISFPPTPVDDDFTTHTKLNRPSPQHDDASTLAEIANAQATDAVATQLLDLTPSDNSSTTKVAQKRPRDPSDDREDHAVAASYARKAFTEPDGPVALPAKIAPPEPDEEANFDDATHELLDLESPERPPKVVRLATEEQQGEDGPDTSRRKSDESEPTKVSRTHLQAQGEVASSPSSTVGAYSAATPLPPQDSPDTSPDSETGEHVEVLPPKELRPSPEEQRQKEEHDRLLEAQKEIAHKQALGDVSSTPDEQLRWEEREAAARDAEERAARDDVGGPEPDSKGTADRTEAGKVVDEVMQDRESEQAETTQPAPQDTKTITDATTEDGRVESTTAEEDGDNITVTPRNRAALTIDTSRPEQASNDATIQPTPGEQERMTTRTSSGVLQKRSISEILGQTPTQAGPSRRNVMSPETISPSALRHPHDTLAFRPSSTFENPRRFSKEPGQFRTQNNSTPTLEDLDALKGAAEDPDRDYLEPLFRIQAHESPNVRTTSLAELVRSASKTLSTEDQFMTVQEKLDYRILRRIYHLQNANKWSLRQMERCKEPEQPVTHHDHMMAEMKWMRKDFKAERKMKISICAWLARRCADWVAASAEERKKIQVKIRSPKQKDVQVEQDEEQPPELEHSGESANEDETDPPTPQALPTVPSTLVVPPELSETVNDLQKAGKLHKVLDSLPVTGFKDTIRQPNRRTLGPVSKFVHGKVLPQAYGTNRKRSRFDYDDDMAQPGSKRLRDEDDLPPEDVDSALFHPENKHIRDRLHANNAFRPPSEFAMPSTQFYEYRSGSQWIWEDDQKLRKLAKEYSFNWSLIADELQLPTCVKSAAERRTPWECFERWVELEQLPTEMKKTVYFKTWFQRLEQSQQAAERRYQAHVAAIQAQSNGQATHVPPRKRSAPNRVDKRKNTRYLWLVDAMRKGARKKEQAAYKAAEAQRAAAQRKNQNESTQPRAPTLTPQEFSKKRHERDLQEIELKRQGHLKFLENQRKLAAARNAHLQAMQQGQQPNGAGPNQQQRPGSSSSGPMQQMQMQAAAQGQQQQANMNGQQARGPLPMNAQRNGHLAVPQMNGQGAPQQAQMRPGGNMPSAQDMQRMAQANAQARGGQYGGQQPYPMSAASLQSPGGSAMTPQQQMASNQAMIASLQQQQQQMGGTGQHQGSNANHQMSASPSMPPPPTPHQQQSHPQSLSSGHVPALLTIKAQIKAAYPNYSEEQVNQIATEMLKSKSQSTNQARLNAMNAAAGINGGVAPQSANMQAFAHNQAAYQNNQMPSNNGAYGANGDMSGAAAMGPNGLASSSPQQQQYAQLMRQRQYQQMRLQQGSPVNGGSPGMAHASPNMTHASPVSPIMQFANPGMAAQMPSMNMQGLPSVAVAGGGGRPPSRSATPQMQRLGSSGSVPGVGGVQSPGQVGGVVVPQGSPRGMQAGVAR